MDKLGRQKVISSASGLAVNHGETFGPDWEGAVFASESAGCTVAAFQPNQKFPETTDYKQAIYPDEKWEKVSFLTTANPRFRPVNTSFGPDGCLYIVDMCRGNVQHKRFQTPYLRKQILETGLDKHINRGRIWRVAPIGYNRVKAMEKPASLIEGLKSQNLWWRLYSQKKIIQGNKIELANDLNKLAQQITASPYSRVHAMWALSELGELEKDTIKEALKDEHWFVKLTGIRLAGEAYDQGAQFPEELKQGLKVLSNSSEGISKDYAQSVLTNGYPKREIPVPKLKAPSHIEQNQVYQKLWSEGHKHYMNICSGCHQENGNGLAGLAPTLDHSDWVTGSKEKLIASVVHGVSGPIHINEKLATGLPPIMPPHGHLSDQQLSEILTYVRNGWTNTGSVISANDIKDYRERNKERLLPWTESELKAAGF